MYQHTKLPCTLLLLISFLQIGVCPIAIANGASPSSEYKIQAAYLRHLASYVRWPAGHEKEITLCIVGKDPFEGFLDELIKEKPLTRDNIPVSIRRLAVGQNIKRCDIAFIDSASINQAFWRAASKQYAVLLVSNSPTFTADHGMVTFYPENNHIRIEINLQNVEKMGLRISSELLKLVKLTSSGNVRGMQ